MLSARNIVDGKIVFDDFRLIDRVDFESEHARTQVAPGDVLLTIVGTIGRTAVVPVTAEPFALQRSVAVLKPAAVESRYLAYALDSPAQQNWFLENAKGTAQKGVYLKVLGEAHIPLAPQAEQVRIVEKLEELLSDLDTGVAELKAAQRKLAQYRQSLLKAAVEGALTADWRAAQRTSSRRRPGPSRSNADQSQQRDPGLRRDDEGKETGAELLQRILRERRARWEQKQLGKFAEQGKTPPKGWQEKYPEPVAPDLTDLPPLPEGWVWVTVDQLSTVVRNGLSQKPEVDPVGYPILRINAVRAMLVNLDEVRYLSISSNEAEPYLLKNGDLLATRYNGSVDLLGVIGVVRGLSRDTLHPDKLIRIEPVLNELLADWIEVAATSGCSRAHVVSRVKTTAGQTGISGDDLKRMPVPLPSMSEQAEITETVSRMLAGINLKRQASDHLLQIAAAQRKNILKAAFSGQLVPQDPNDEPASELLARIRAQREANADAPARKRGRKAKGAA